jgi:hypothetical protein
VDIEISPKLNVIFISEPRFFHQEEEKSPHMAILRGASSPGVGPIPRIVVPNLVRGRGAFGATHIGAV